MCLEECLHSFLEKNNLIFKRHFVLRSGNSSDHTIVNLFESIKKYTDNDNYVGSVFIDLEKAFDTVDHQILLQQVYHYGIPGLAHNWFGLYLSNRQQFGSISGFFSELISIKCGVSQGSILGPFLSLLYINDLDSVFNKVMTIKFPDDTHISYASKNLSTIESVKSYELKKLAKLAEWLRSNKLSLSSGKSELVIFHSKTKNEL